MRNRFLVVALVAVLSAVCVSGFPNIYLDEDFEGAAAFSNQGYPVVDDGSGVGSPVSLAPKGVNIRAHTGGTDSNTDQVSMQGTGAMVSSRYFLGARSYEMQPGQTLSINSDFPPRFGGPFHFHQFAVSVAADDAEQAAGTVLGRYSSEYSLNDNFAAIEETVIIELVVSGTADVDIIAKTSTMPSGTKIGSMYAGPGQWAVISVVVNAHSYAPTTPWNGWDPISSVFKGPLSGNEDTGDPLNTTNNPALDLGVNFYVNSIASAATFLPGVELSSDWGTPSGAPLPESTYMMDWRWEAVDGTVYLDNMLWSIGLHHNPNYLISQEAAARMLPFDAATSEPSEASAGAAWLLY